VESRTKIINDKREEIKKRLRALNSQTLLVGIPAGNNAREDGTISNSTLAFIHEFGAPEVNIPARPFMFPGIVKSSDEIVKHMKQAVFNAIAGKPGLISDSLNQLGAIVRDKIKAHIRDGIPPPLKAETIENRHRGRKTAMRGNEKEYLKKLKSGEAMELFAGGTPLINTAAMLNAITYVIRRTR
jgi:hypothetical protein